MSYWPSSNDYTAAIQSPQICFRDPDLTTASVEKNKLTRMPKVWTGNFAQVYELRNSTKKWAVKCFTRSGSDIRLRYSELSKAITGSRLPYFVEFRFIDDEMLVNGKRYPIVKMQWVDGESLDKHIEGNLYRPQVLLDTAGKLLTMVKELEAHQLAHGDLQHGNVVITSAGLRLVDYDGMFVPAFNGRPSAENGLPSYQHPRRGPSDFAVGLDRFSLLVICTGLCALASDPSLWYEFYTGDNLLFTSNDFKDPKSSKLFRRLSTLNDARLRTFADQLRMACVQNPLFAPIPSAIPVQTGLRQTPWWVTVQTPSSTSGTREAPAPRPTDSPRVTQFRHVGAVTLSIIGVCALALGGLLSINAALVAALIGALGYLMERLGRYNALPALHRQRELQAKLEQLRRDLRNETSNKNALEQQMFGLTQQENQEKAQEIRRLQEAHAAGYLSRIPISGLMNISGIGPFVVGNFQAAGINNALQLKQRGPYVTGVGTKRRSQILVMLSQWERAAAQGSPQALPSDTETRITTKYHQQRQALASQIGAVGRRIAARGSHVSQAESELKQLHIPTFSQFLKNTF